MAKLPTVQRLSRQVAETAICEVEYKGKTISEWCELFCKGDLVEVVRCKDCKYYVANYCTRDIRGRTNMFYMSDNDFCSYGAKKDGEENGL